MGDIVSTRPASGAPIATAWGAEIHDAIEGIQTGTVVITLASQALATTVITFPRAYAAPPKCFLTVALTFTNSAIHAWIPGAGVSGTQLNIAAGRDDGVTASGSITINWLAIGQPA